MQEIHTALTMEANWWQEWGDRVYFSHLTETSCRVATLFSPSLQPEVPLTNEVVPGCLLHLQIQIQGLILNLVNIYALCMTQRWPFLLTYLGTLIPREFLVLGRDFNVTLEGPHWTTLIGSGVRALWGHH